MQHGGQRGGVARRHEHALPAVGDDVAVAGDVRRDDRGAGREGLRQHHAEGLAAERRGDEQVGGGELGELAGLVDRAERAHAGRIVDQRRELARG